MSATISNDDNRIDAGDVIARLEALKKSQQEIEAELETLKRPASNDVNTRIETLKENQQDIAAELEALESLVEETRAYTEWRKDTVLIRDSYFTDYAQDLAKKTVCLPKDDLSLSWDMWPLSCINWERAARQLQTDYSPVEFDGVTYWVLCE